jgi:hypothetical protein
MADFQSYDEMAHEGDKYCRELEGWLTTFSDGKKKRPDNEIVSKRRRLAWVRKAVEIFRRGAHKVKDEAA